MKFPTWLSILLLAALSTVVGADWSSWVPLGDNVSVSYSQVNTTTWTWKFRNDGNSMVTYMEFQYRDTEGAHNSVLPNDLGPGEAFGGWVAFTASSQPSIKITKIKRSERFNKTNLDSSPSPGKSGRSPDEGARIDSSNAQTSPRIRNAITNQGWMDTSITEDNVFYEKHFTCTIRQLIVGEPGNLKVTIQWLGRRAPVWSDEDRKQFHIESEEKTTRDFFSYTIPRSSILFVGLLSHNGNLPYEVYINAENSVWKRSADTIRRPPEEKPLSWGPSEWIEEKRHIVWPAQKVNSVKLHFESEKTARAAVAGLEKFVTSSELPSSQPNGEKALADAVPSSLTPPWELSPHSVVDDATRKTNGVSNTSSPKTQQQTTATPNELPSRQPNSEKALAGAVPSSLTPAWELSSHSVADAATRKTNGVSNTSSPKTQPKTTATPKPKDLNQSDGAERDAATADRQSRHHLYRVSERVKEPDTLSVRRAPGVLSDLVSYLPAEATDIEVIGNEVDVGSDRWAWIRWRNISGWVSKKFLSPLELDETED